MVDVDGGNGTLFAAILNAAPKLRGTFFDSPSGSAEASRQLEASGLADRCEVMTGDFFRSVPAGAGGCMLPRLISQWGDGRRVTILQKRWLAVSPRRRVLAVVRRVPARRGASARRQ